jgi:heme/copper-type cytochrome/quinol oxidase subunit 2
MGFLPFASSEGPVSHDLSVFSPASPSGESIRDLFILVLAITGGIFLLVEGVLVYSLLRNRRRAAAGEAEPPQVYGSTPIEIAWTAAPLLIVFVHFLVVARTEWELRLTGCSGWSDAIALWTGQRSVGEGAGPPTRGSNQVVNT